MFASQRLICMAATRSEGRMRWPSGAPIRLKLPKQHDGHHLFLSHKWGGGQDVMRVLKERLSAMVPGISIFLDVDQDGTSTTSLPGSASARDLQGCGSAP